MNTMLPLIKKVLSIAKKVFIVFAIYIVIINLFFYFLSKNKPKQIVNPIKENRRAIYQNINDPQLNKTAAGKKAIAFYKALNCLLIGEACTKNPSDGDKNYEKSIFGGVAKLIVLPYQYPAASGVYWTHTGLSAAGFIPKTHAQGIGFTALQPLSDLWKIFRDMVYLLLVIVLVAIGFMIMFRVKVNPQTIISLENALPRIVISLILITFSFPIAGFLIDIMYVVSAIGINILAANKIAPFSAQEFQTSYFSNGFFLFDKVFFNGDYWGVGPALFDILPRMVDILLRVTIGAGVYMLLNNEKLGPIASFISGDFVNNVGGVTGGLLKFVVAGLLALVLIPLIGQLVPIILSILIFFTALYIFFRIFFFLFKSYLMLLIYIIFSPIILLFEAFPGKSFFIYWLKHLVANLLVFPLTAFLILISSIIVAAPVTGERAGFWAPPFLTSSSPKAFSVLVGIGLLFLIPDILKLVQSFVGVKESPLKASPGVFFGGFGAAGGGVTGIAQKYYYLKMVPGVEPMLRKIGSRMFQTARETTSGGGGGGGGGQGGPAGG